MTIDDATRYPMDDPEPLGQTFGEVFDLVDETIEGITDAEIEERLHQLLADTTEPVETFDLDELARVLRSYGWDICRRRESMFHDLLSPDWDEVHCALESAYKELALRRAQAEVARREAAEQVAALTAARQQAAEVTNGINAYVDAALDRAQSVLDDAQVQAARLLAAAEQQAAQIISTARLQAAPAEVTPVNAWSAFRRADRSLLLVAAPPGGGKTYTLLTALERYLALLGNERGSSSNGWRFWRPVGLRSLWQPLANKAEFRDALVSRKLVQFIQTTSTCSPESRAKRTFWTEGAFREVLTDWDSSARGRLRDALQRWIAVASVPAPLTGSFCRSVQIDLSHNGETPVGLCVVLDEPNMLLVTHATQTDPEGQGERRQATGSLPRNSPLPPNLNEGIETEGKRELEGLGDIQSFWQCLESVGQALLEAAPTLTVFYTHADAVTTWPMPPRLDLENLRHAEYKQPAQAGDHSTAKPGRPEVYGFSGRA
ncbi:hypothetical protein ACIBO1_07690 [Micromonospora sp. NPDC049903]|uniref:hypothetical protein n=1 Tax=Micromonospora sp. NPDC049903 TaxID=3364276 RepID=UPI003790123F